MDSLRIFDVIYATTTGGPNDATTNLQIMAYQYSFQWYQMGKGMAQAIVLAAAGRDGQLPADAAVEPRVRRARPMKSCRADVSRRPLSADRAARRHRAGTVLLLVWTVFPFCLDPADVAEEPGGHPLGAADLRLHADARQLRGAGGRGATRAVLLDASRFPAFFLNSMIISVGAVALSVAAGIPAAYALARFNFPGKNTLAFVL